MNTLYKHIEADFFQLSNTNRLIANAIMRYKDSHFDLKLTDLAKQSYCSNAAITKFIHYFGYTSYKVFVNDLNKKEITSYDGMIESFKIIDQYFMTHKDTIVELLEHIKAAKKVYIFGTGQSAVAPLDFTLKCNKKDPDKFMFETNPTMQQLLLQTVHKQDLCLFVSNSGESRELIQFYKDIKYPENCILISNRESSTLSKAITNYIILNNHIEPPYSFKEFSKESKYSLIYFFDRIFEELYPNVK